MRLRRGAIALVALLGLNLGAARSRAAPFDAERAMRDIHRQVAFGTRIPGTAGHEACRKWIKAEIEALGLTLWEQPFEARLSLTGARARAYNLWGLPPGLNQPGGGARGRKVILLSAHWDTRPLADEEPPNRLQTPYLGANDGASGVAVALGIVRALRGTALEGRVALVFFDAEDSGIQNKKRSWCLGSWYAAERLPDWFDRVRLGINLDMVGGRGMRLGREEHSRRAQPEALDRLWKIGLVLTPEIFTRSSVGAITDDHLPFIEAGRPYIDLIGIPYAYWHRLGDLPEACDPLVMSRLAMTLVEFIAGELARAD